MNNKEKWAHLKVVIMLAPENDENGSTHKSVMALTNKIETDGGSVTILNQSYNDYLGKNVLQTAEQLLIENQQYDLLYVAGGHGFAENFNDSCGVKGSKFNSLSPQSAQQFIALCNKKNIQFQNIFLGFCVSAFFVNDFRAILAPNGAILSFITQTYDDLSKKLVEYFIENKKIDVDYVQYNIKNLDLDIENIEQTRQLINLLENNNDSYLNKLNKVEEINKATCTKILQRIASQQISVKQPYQACAELILKETAVNLKCALASMIMLSGHKKHFLTKNNISPWGVKHTDHENFYQPFVQQNKNTVVFVTSTVLQKLFEVANFNNNLNHQNSENNSKDSLLNLPPPSVASLAQIGKMHKSYNQQNKNLNNLNDTNSDALSLCAIQ